MGRAVRAIQCAVACGCVGAGVGVVISLVSIAQRVSNVADVRSRVRTMSVAEDFERIDGGCTVLTASAMLYSFSYYSAASSSCTSQCSAARGAACSKRVVYTFEVNSNRSVQYESAPEDELLRVADTCEACGDECLSQEPAWSSEARPRIGTTVPCWRPLRPDITREDLIMDGDPRTASYAGVSSCAGYCLGHVGYRCGNAPCFKIADPAEERAYLQGYSPPDLPLFIGVAAGCGGALLLICVLGALQRSGRCGARCSDDSDDEDEPDAEGEGGLCDADWADLTAQQREAARTLGYDQRAWDKDASVPADGKAWAELSAAEQQAASTLGYTEHSWDAED